MVRLFQRHHKRNTRLLDGLWQFKIDPDLRGVKEEWFNEFPADHQSIIVPSCWNHELGLYHYEGVAWYQTFFETNSPQVNLVFHGFYGQIKVYVDGQHIGGQYGGFAGFECLVTGLEPGKHQLVVMTDNTHNHLNTIPLARVDWFHYGGLFRSVEIMELADVWIKDYQIDYQLDANLTNAEIKIQVTLESFNGLNDCELTVSVNGERLYNQAVRTGVLPCP